MGIRHNVRRTHRAALGGLVLRVSGQRVSRGRNSSDALSTLDYVCKFLLGVLGMQ